jgi:aprataxin
MSADVIEQRRNAAHETLKEKGMKCWRCGKNFGSQFKKLKEHLEDEFQAWRKE